MSDLAKFAGLQGQQQDAGKMGIGGALQGLGSVLSPITSMFTAPPPKMEMAPMAPQQPNVIPFSSAGQADPSAWMRAFQLQGT